MQCLKQFLQKKKLLLSIIFLAALIQAFGTLLVPYFVAAMIDTGIRQQNIPMIITIGRQMLLAAAGTALIALAGSYLCAQLVAQLGQQLRTELFAKTQELSLKEFNDFGTASLINRFTGDITIIQQSLLMALQMALPTPLVVVTALAMTAAVNSSLLYVPLTGMFIFLLVIVILFIKAGPLSRTIQERMDNMNRLVRESIVGIRVIRAFANAGYERQRSDAAFDEYAEHAITLNKIFATFNPLVWLIMGFTMAAVMWLGGYLVLGQTIQVGSIAAVTEYCVMTLIYLMIAAIVLVNMPRMMASLERIQEVLDSEVSIVDGRSNVEYSETAPKIEFRDVEFAYQGAEKPVVTKLNFICAQGKTTAIIGGTGSGKSTVAALLLRLYDIKKGEILLEGQDLRSISQEEVRRKISYVPQKAFLFSGTIADNLRMGKRSATDEELRQAASIAQVSDFIDSLPEGYETLVAQGGGNFSGGQKQRLCIARALAKAAPVYVFDDSFSALDFQTDAALRKALHREIADAAVIIIAQRISTIMSADQIIVLEDGQVAGIGTHKELLENCRVYREIAASQLASKEVAHT